MRYFNSDTNSFWSNKVNFADENNVLVGYDFGGMCCEDFGWYVSDKVTTDHLDFLFDDTVQDVNSLLEGWTFDTAFFERLNPSIEGNYEDDNRVVFRMVNGDKEQFLHLYNVHNGYYSHGFEFSQDDKVLQVGSL